METVLLPQKPFLNWTGFCSVDVCCRAQKDAAVHLHFAHYLYTFNVLLVPLPRQQGQVKSQWDRFWNRKFLLIIICFIARNVLEGTACS